MPGLAVVTGASSGIGAATAVRLADDGYHVVLVARRKARLESLADKIQGRVAQVDVTDRAAVRTMTDSIPSCDVLVNNAGGAFGADEVATGDPADWERMFQINVLGTLHLTQALLPKLSAGSGGTIVNITSTAASVNYETGGGYSAAKHAQHALTETLRLELCGQPVRVVEIAPGMVRTDEFALNRFRGDAARAAAVYAGVEQPLSAEDVAACVSFVVGLPGHVNVDRLVVRPLAQAAQHKVHRSAIGAAPVQQTATARSGPPGVPGCAI
ncbi:SDR family oxidoreductase [Solwaraspora sp. WMMD406]|uniref:SDR family oxidoreductase n=1 Tax=Solwaraspora sp. WMMD406 TaxID=3016095 RepID=UPI002415AAD5|nr:SDR family oxidoreductase [Solwaraspora sp. WMMD406]MDG4767441.1 SDR family oxidoreductase [Solwaraspora sp. WMMD406]